MAYLWRQLGDAPKASRDTAPAIPVEAQSVLDYWFGTAGSAEYATQREMWFRKDEAFNRDIAQRFGPLIERALRGELEDWASTPSGALAQILLLDQFTRNTMRDTPRAFAGDARALKAAITMVGRGQDESLLPVQRTFIYTPFEHSEDMAMQDEAIRLFSRLTQAAPDMRSYGEYAVRHRAVIARFGRFPHRNNILRRQSSPEEVDFLREPGSRF
jgi:uncharacterized protein (DUF924 family)